ncbi:MbcA/ParS/Xre antitoxin family protein [Ancylomarina sp. 16SWW S1-10-2]|uniref:MbcA/ParS/Xre antitoxin family protein n=1 Tax=Ancylomarina sp. 16SWW S1-10-2 TaxID=2499681 RepID=UPI0012AE480D|nr:MbcA/ParS/Xre antitoxin family protein [Ancylomarina sp. 16SWW S1-10-2]MRT91906.1 DUF2384 domain-containing protein [Ancylomarina sp. 16SWW S1-10-2]
MEQQLPPISEKLAHLSSEQIEELCQKYNDGEKIKILIRDYNIDIHASGFYNLLPPILSEDELCPYCNVQMLQNRPRRTSSVNKAYCPICGHDNSDRCCCSSCELERQNQQRIIIEKSVEILNNHYNVDTNKQTVVVQDLPLYDKLYLSAFLRYANEDDSKTLDCRKLNQKLSPTKSFDHEIISSLLKKSYIRICGIDVPKSQSQNEEQFAESTELNKLCYQLNLQIDGQTDDEIYNQLFYPNLSNAEEVELRDLWKRIATEECVEYVKFNFKRLRLKWDILDIHKKHIDNILMNFSVGQFFLFFHNSLKGAVLELQVGKITRIQCIHYSIKGAVFSAERVNASRRTIKPFHRFDLKQSIISHLFYSVFLGIDKKGFYECPNTYRFMNTGISLKIVNEKGLLVFGSTKKYTKWLDEECIRLGNIKPSELLNNTEGLEEVFIMLLRLDTGLYC